MRSVHYRCLTEIYTSLGTPIITELGKYLVKVNNEGTKTMSTGIQYLFMQKIRFNHYLIHFILSQYSISIPPENVRKYLVF